MEKVISALSKTSVSQDVECKRTLFGENRGAEPPPTKARILQRKSISTQPTPPLSKSLRNCRSVRRAFTYWTSRRLDPGPKSILPLVLESTQEPWMAMRCSARGRDASQTPGDVPETPNYTRSSVHRLLKWLAIIHSEARADAAGETCVVLIEANVEELKSFLPFIRRSCHIPRLPPTSQVIPVSRPVLRMSGNAILIPRGHSRQDRTIQIRALLLL